MFTLSNLAPLLLCAGAAAIMFGADWFFRGLRPARKPYIPPAPPGEDPAKHEHAYIQSTGPHRVPQTAFGYPAHTSPGIRGLRPASRRRGPTVVASHRPSGELSANPPRLIPSPLESTERMPRIKQGHRR